MQDIFARGLAVAASYADNCACVFFSKLSRQALDGFCGICDQNLRQGQHPDMPGRQ